MTPRKNFVGALRRALSAFGLVALGACTAAAPTSQKAPQIPDRIPERALQALSSSDDEDGDADAYCLDGVATIEEYNEDGSFLTEWDCAPGGGIDRIRTEGSGDELGDGAYTQTTFLESGAAQVWLFTYDTSEDFLSTAYAGHAEDGSESYSGVYTYLDEERTQMHEDWNLREGRYVVDGVLSGAQGELFAGTQSFDDPATVASPDVEASYDTAADGSSSGTWTQRFDDGSLTHVSYELRADGSVSQSWTFDDAATALPIDQEGSMEYLADGSGSGSYTVHGEDGASQTCDVQVGADGSQDIGNCH